MVVHEAKEKYGLREYPTHRHRSRRVCIIGVKPLTEEDKEWNIQQIQNRGLAEEYNKLRQELIYLLDDRIFLAQSLNFVYSRVAGIRMRNLRFSPEYEETDERFELVERIRNVRVRLSDARLTYDADICTLQMLNGALMNGNIGQQPDVPEEDTPEILYRVFSENSHTRYDKHLGFRCSKQPLTSPYGAQSLQASGLMDAEMLRNHCEGNQPSELIALSDSPWRIFNIIKLWDIKDETEKNVAVISVSKLLAMGVLFNRTTTLAESLGIALKRKNRPDGLQYANQNYWVAYRWIPAECIEFYTSISDLRTICKHHGVCI